MLSLFYLITGVSLALSFWLPDFAFVLIHLAFLWMLCSPYLKYGQISEMPEFLSPESTFCLTILVFSIVMFIQGGLRFPTSLASAVMARVVLGLAVCISGFLLVHYLRTRDARLEITTPPLLWGFRTLALLFFLTRVMTVYCSLRPDTKFFNEATLAASEFLAGVNPYSDSPYDSVFREALGVQASVGRFADWPTILYWLVPFFAIFNDIRVGLVVADLIVVFTLVGFARILHVKTSLKWLMPLAWMGFPLHPYVVETGAFVPVLVMGTALTLLGVFNGQWVFAGICLGIASAASPSILLLAFFSVLWIYWIHGRKAATKFGLSALAPFVISLLPFLSADPVSLWHQTVVLFMGSTDSGWSLSFPDLLAGFSLHLPWWLMGVLRAVGLVIVCWMLSHRRGLYQQRVYSHEGLVQGLLVLYLGFFLFGPGTSGVHYYFVAFLAISSIAASLHRFRLT